MGKWIVQVPKKWLIKNVKNTEDTQSIDQIIDEMVMTFMSA